MIHKLGEGRGYKAEVSNVRSTGQMYHALGHVNPHFSERGKVALHHVMTT